MKGVLISFVAGTLLGVVYGVIKVKSPAPPIVALVGLLGMVLGEQGGGWLLAKKIQVRDVASAPIAAQSDDHQQSPNVQSAASLVYEKSRK
jgi:XapX domain-containing protein